MQVVTMQGQSSQLNEQNAMLVEGSLGRRGWYSCFGGAHFVRVFKFQNSSVSYASYVPGQKKTPEICIVEIIKA